jgi:hypothetical protein
MDSKIVINFKATNVLDNDQIVKAQRTKKSTIKRVVIV